ncbi:MAG: diguanylate cyclase, partial [Campylobacterota bacterium]|nr:diguanylate cyclase [Campylobacterota bacterium]
MLPLIGMLILIFIILWSNYNKHEEMKKTSSITHILSNINELAHVIQIERGLSCGYISSSQNKFRNSLYKQRKIVDNTIESFTNKLKSVDSYKYLDIKPYIDIFKKDISTLNHFRQKVDKKELSQNTTLNFYTNIIRNILGITSKMALFNLNREVSSSILTLSSLSHYKETLGLKRASGTAIIEKDNTTIKEYVKFIQLLGTQEAFLNNFNHTASHTQKKSLDSIINCDLSKKITLYEESIKNRNFKDIDSSVWFDHMTELINHIKLFEDKLLSEIDMLIENNIQRVVKNLFLWLIYTTFIFVVTFIIIYLFEYSSKKEISKFTDAMKHLAQGKRSLRLRANTTKGEMAQMYNAYEVTRQKLLKGDMYTQLYLTQKELEIKEKQKQNIKLEEMASIDPLTGCFNRRKFEELSYLELERATRYKSDLSFLMLDIDHFKAVNDTYGHGVGDEVLKDFSSICLEMARDLDVVARIGGEEFVVMLPQTNSKGAYIFAERFRKKIFNTSVSAENQTIKYSVSIGISALDASKDKDVKTILQRADKALYSAKESGRNATHIYKI